TRAPRPTLRSPKPLQAWSRPQADLREVAEAARDPERLVIDVRDPSRYRGEADPFDPSPGHIPGAVNAPYATNLGPDGRFLPAAELARKYRDLLGERAPEQVIVACGSGVTACHTLLAMERAGLGGAKLYVGSFSEWSRSGRAIATGDEPGTDAGSGPSDG
ncbi:MAG: rhodanese-like domain-containing protein, partial [Myxococcota bacterium]|nr:rhodanese-like domain-containing protein [Myxococcota bacterium]